MPTSDLQKVRMRLFFQQNKDRYSYYGTRFRDQLRAEMVEAYGGECQWCEEKDIFVLTLDHIDDDSYVEKQLYGENQRGGHKIYARLKTEGWPKNRFQLLCFNCNAKKEHHRKREAREIRWGTEDEIFGRPKRAGETIRINNLSGFKGVSWNKQKHRWQAKITVNRLERNLGHYKDLGDAARAYKKAALASWGSMANVPSEEEIDAIVKQQEQRQVMSQELATELGLE